VGTSQLWDDIPVFKNIFYSFEYPGQWTLFQVYDITDIVVETKGCGSRGSQTCDLPSRINVVAFRVPVLSSLVNCINIPPSVFGLYLLVL
jgi:hypothetical protein